MTGVNPPPYMAIKLLRLLRHMELPGVSWQGWRFSRGMLVTPEGRTISGQDGAWWSLLVRRAQGFNELYQRQRAYALTQSNTVPSSGLGAAGTLPDVGLVPFKTNSVGFLTTPNQDGAIIGPWPTISDYQPPLMPTHASAVSASASALTPSFALPWMPTSGSQTPQPHQHPYVVDKTTKPAPGPQQAPQTSTPALPGLRLTPMPAHLQLVNPTNPANPQNSAKQSAGPSLTSSAKPANADSQVLGKEAA